MPSTVEAASRRLFIGLMANEAVRDGVERWCEGWQWPSGAALSPPAQWHITLVFLGQVLESALPALRAALAQVRFEPLHLRLGQPELWPRGIAVVRPLPHQSLDALHRRVAQTVQMAGLALPEMGWKPHLTLARKATGAIPPGQALVVDWRVSEFSLVWSRTRPQGDQQRYEVLERWA